MTRATFTAAIALYVQRGAPHTVETTVKTERTRVTRCNRRSVPDSARFPVQENPRK